MRANLSNLSIAALTAALSFPVAASVDAVSSTISADASSGGAKDQPTKMAMKCGKKYDMKKRNGKDCEDCDGNCGANCFKK
jgi:hypothetical protein